MTIKKELEKAGLTDKEASVYLAVLELGEASIAGIAKKSKIKRSTVYLAVDSLKSNGFLSMARKGSKTYFYAEDPRNIQRKIEEKKEAISKVMPELLASFVFLDKKPNVRYFEGESGIKEVYQDILKYPNQEMLTMFSSHSLKYDEKFFLDYFIPKRKEKKIWVRAILPDNETIREFSRNDVEHLRRSRFVSAEKFKLSIELEIYGKNKLAVVSYKDNLALMIESQDIHDSMKSIFEVMWEGAGKE